MPLSAACRDFPGQLDFFDPSFDTEMIFGTCGALIFVIDAQDDYSEALTKLHATVTKAVQVNPKIRFEVFIHKVDGLADENKIERQREIQQRALNDLHDSKIDSVHLSWYLTSIYDHSIFEAFSKVVQKLIPQLPTLENLLDVLQSVRTLPQSTLLMVVVLTRLPTELPHREVVPHRRREQDLHRH